MKQRIVLLGPPASGKGTQAQLIEERYGIPATSTGAILREQKRSGTELGIEAEKYTRRGQLVPDQLIIDLIRGWLAAHNSKFTFDGFPRTLGQAEALTTLLKQRQTPLEMVISLDVDFETLVDRVQRRMFCQKCGHVVRVGLHVSSSSDPCPRCGGALERRHDDEPETLKERMREYHEKTEPLFSYYEEQKLLRRVPAADRPENVFAELVKILEER